MRSPKPISHCSSEVSTVSHSSTSSGRSVGSVDVIVRRGVSVELVGASSSLLPPVVVTGGLGVLVGVWVGFGGSACSSVVPIHSMYAFWQLFLEHSRQLDELDDDTHGHQQVLVVHVMTSP